MNELKDGMREPLLAWTGLTERVLPLAGVSTAVLEGGAGPPVILLHSSGEFAALWSRVIPDLLPAHRVIAPDLPGHGASTGVDGELDADRVLGWLGELIDRTCAAPPVLVGHGLGGAIAARFAAGHGDRVDRLVLVDAFGLAGSSRRRVSEPRCTVSWAGRPKTPGTASSGNASWIWTGCALRWASGGRRWRPIRSTGPAHRLSRAPWAS